LDEHRESDEVNDDWRVAPRQLEDVYSVADAVVLGDLLMTLLRNCDRVTAASLAQLVNVIAPIMTEPGGDAWRQTTFFPFSVTSRLAQGSALRARITADTYATAEHGEAPLLDALGTFDDKTGTGAVFLVNRSTTEAQTVTVDARSLAASRIVEAVTLSDADPYAKNTLADQHRVGLVPNESAAISDGVVTVVLPPVSWTALSLA
jgi:alpha-N-arabinofuranosidase